MKTIKNLVIASILAALVLSSAPTSALAWGIGVGGPWNANAPAKQERLKHASGNIKTASENKARAKAKREEAKQKSLNNVAERHANRLERRFALYDARLGSIAKKLRERVNKLVAEGKDMDAALAILNKLESNDEEESILKKAQATGDSAVDMFRAIDSGPFPEQKEDAFAARDEAKKARQLYKEALVQLKKALMLAKESIRAGEQDAD